ncbi:MAG: hypothetical protein KBD21_04175 [Candidatus Pacebacteria bacterium]|nr:hypothetical protein [Candidatus Paceibacterota bacterium]
MELVQIFNAIRDIPYKISLSNDDLAVDCDQKHKRLAAEFKNLGVETRFRICSFLWSSMPLPEDVLSVPHVDTCEHLFVEAYIGVRWVVLDVTWDSALRTVLPVNEWDGRSDTELAVTPILVYPAAEERELVHNSSEESFEKDLTDSGLFYRALNEWLESVRRKN